MKATRYTYADEHMQRYQFVVRKTRNGYAIQAYNTAHVVCVPLTPTVAESLDLTLPEGYRIEQTNFDAAQSVLDSIAATNGLVALKDTDMN